MRVELVLCMHAQSGAVDFMHNKNLGGTLTCVVCKEKKNTLGEQEGTVMLTGAALVFGGLHKVLEGPGYVGLQALLLAGRGCQLLLHTLHQQRAQPRPCCNCAIVSTVTCGQMQWLWHSAL